MSARIVRSQEPKEESPQGVVINPPSYAPGAQPSDTPPPVSVELIEYLKKRFPDRIPAYGLIVPRADEALADVARRQGWIDVIDHLGSILKPEE